MQRMDIMRPEDIAMRAGGAESWAAVTRVVRAMPKPTPRMAGYPQTAAEEEGVTVAIRAAVVSDGLGVRRGNVTNH